MSTLLSLNNETSSEVILSKLKCGICNQIAKEPYISDCNHLFCYKCLKSLTSNKFICPLHEKSIIDRRKCKEFNNEYYINTIVIVCPEQSFGCQWVGLVKDFDNHYKLNHSYIYNNNYINN